MQLAKADQKLPKIVVFFFNLQLNSVEYQRAFSAGTIIKIKLRSCKKQFIRLRRKFQQKIFRLRI